VAGRPWYGASRACNEMVQGFPACEQSYRQMTNHPSGGVKKFGDRYEPPEPCACVSETGAAVGGAGTGVRASGSRGGRKEHEASSTQRADTAMVERM